MKNYTAHVRMMDKSLEIFTADSDDIHAVEVMAMESLFAAGKHPNTVEMVYVTPPFKDAYFIKTEGDTVTIQDAAIWDGVGVYKGRYSGRTLEEMQFEENGVISLMEWEEAYPLYEASQARKYIGPVKEIDRDRFNYLLEVLPPMGWHHDAIAESFKLCERLTGNITTIAARIGGRCYEFNDNASLSHKDIIAKIGKAVIDGTLVKL